MKYFITGMVILVICLTGLSVVGYFYSADDPVRISTISNLNLTQKSNNTQFRLSSSQLGYVTANTSDTLFLFGEVAEENSEALAQAILGMNASKSVSPILLVIDSPGGAVFAGSKVISAIEASKRPVYTICYGLCASMAAMIHQYGHKRLMTNRSVLMFHNASGGAQGEVNQMLSQLHFVDRFCLKMDSYVEKRSGISHDDFSRLLDSQLWIDSQDALSSGFVDNIVALNLNNVKKSTLLPFLNRSRHALDRIEIRQ